MYYAQEKADTLQSVETILVYHFKDRAPLWIALQAAGSFCPGEGISKDGSKRLAILGDAVLKLALVEDWYHSGAEKGQWRFQRTIKISQAFTRLI